MDLPGGYRRDSGGGDLGIYCLRHQQPRPARAGADHGGGDVQSPLYLGKGDFNVPVLFTAVLELCFAGIAAVILNSWLQRKPKVTRTRAVRGKPIPLHESVSTQPTAPTPPPVVVPVQASVSAPSSAPDGRDRAGPRYRRPQGQRQRKQHPRRGRRQVNSGHRLKHHRSLRQLRRLRLRRRSRQNRSRLKRFITTSWQNLSILRKTTRPFRRRLTLLLTPSLSLCRSRAEPGFSRRFS